MNRKEEQQLACVCHAMNVLPVWGLAFAVWIWYRHRYESEFLREQSKQAIFFHAAFLAAALVLGVAQLVALLMGAIFRPLGFLLGWINLILFCAIWIVYTLTCAWGAWRTWEGETFRYPLIGEFAE